MGDQLDIFQPEGAVVKHSAAVQIAGTISLAERKIWNVLYQRAYGDFGKQAEHHIALSDLIEETGLNTRNHQYIKDCLEGLIVSVKWNIFGADTEIEWGVAALLSSASLKDGIVTYAFDPQLAKRLDNPRIFARISMAAQRDFSSKYALPLYELVIDFSWSNGKSETPWLPVEEVREFMGAVETHPGFYELRRYVLDRAVEEVNEHTNFECWFETKKTGRRVSHVKFLAQGPPRSAHRLPA